MSIALQPGVSIIRRNPRRAYKLAMRVRFIGWLDHWLTDAMNDPCPRRRTRRLFHLVCLCRALGMRDKAAQIMHDAPITVGKKEAIELHKADMVFRAHDFSELDHVETQRRYQERKRAYARVYDAVPERQEHKRLMRQARRNA